MSLTTFYLENNQLLIENILNVTIFKLFCEINHKIFEEVNIENIDDDNLKVNILMKHLFKDLGISQQFLQFHFKHDKQNMLFHLISDRDPTVSIPTNAVFLPLNIIIHYTKITEHKFQMQFDSNYTSEINETYIKNIINRFMNTIINNLKQHINTYTC